MNVPTTAATCCAVGQFDSRLLKNDALSRGNRIPRQGTYRLPESSGLAYGKQLEHGRRPLQAAAPSPNATKSRPGYRQRVTKCKNIYPYVRKSNQFCRFAENLASPSSSAGPIEIRTGCGLRLVPLRQIKDLAPKFVRIIPTLLRTSVRGAAATGSRTCFCSRFTSSCTRPCIR